MSQLETCLAELFSGDDERAEAAVQRMVALPGQERSSLLSVLQAELRAEQADRRWWAVRALATLPEPQAVSLMVGMLEDEQPSVRQCAALGIGLRPVESAVPALIPLLSDPDRLCADLAADALAAIGAPAVEMLLEVLQEGSHSARLLAARALAQIGDQRAIPAFFSLLDQDSALLEYWATEGLERMGVGMLFFDPQ